MYEIPDKLKNLYRHWDDHTASHKSSAEGLLNKDIFKSIELFMAERMHVWYRRNTNKEPYTTDPILSGYRFCNMYRELDRQTIQIHSLLASLRNDFPLWLLNAAFCRFVCNPNTVEKTGLLNFDTANNQKVYERLLSLPSPKYGTAYIFPISTIQKTDNPTREKFFCFYLPQIIPAVAEVIKRQHKASVSELLPEIKKAFGFNFTFHWTEILIDTAYQYPKHLDLFGRFPIGPGSLPTMRRLSSDNPEDVLLRLVAYNPKNFPYLTHNARKVFLSAENWEGVGCEYRKYTNLGLGKGRKRIYKQITGEQA